MQTNIQVIANAYEKAMEANISNELKEKLQHFCKVKEHLDCNQLGMNMFS